MRDERFYLPYPAAWLGIVVVLFLTFCVWFANVTPYRSSGIVNRQPVQDVGAPDERQHANYVARIARGESIPVFNPKDPNLYETYQSHQPPLYYFYSAAAAKLSGSDDPASPSFGRAVRLANALWGVAAILGTYWLGVWGFRDRRIALAGAAILGLMPMFVALCSAINNDPMLFALSSWSLAVIAYGLRYGWSMRVAAILGLLLGLAAVTKTTALAMYPVALFAMVGFKGKRAPLPAVLVGAGLAVAIAAPWWIRNTQMYGDPFAIGAFNDAFVGSPRADMFIEADGLWNYWIQSWVGWWTARSWFGAFGYMDHFWEPTLYRVLMAFALVLLLGWVLDQKTEQAKEDRPATWVCGLYLALILLFFIRFNMTYFQAQARYLYPAGGVIALGMGTGLVYFAKERFVAAWVAVVVILAGLCAYTATWLPGQFETRSRATRTLL